MTVSCTARETVCSTTCDPVKLCTRKVKDVVINIVLMMNILMVSEWVVDPFVLSKGTIIITTMVNFDGDFDGDVTCKQNSIYYTREWENQTLDNFQAVILVGTNYAILVDKGNANATSLWSHSNRRFESLESCNVIRFPTLFKISSKNRSLPVQCEKLFLARNYCNPISSTTTGEYPGHQWRFIRHTIKPLNCHRSGNPVFH